MSMKPQGSPGRDAAASDGNAMTGYDQQTALDGDASNQARTVFGFDGNSRTGQGPSGPAPRSAPAPQAAPAPKLGPKPVKKLEPAPERKNLEPVKDRPEKRADAKPAASARLRGPSPFKAPKPRPPKPY